MQGRVGVVVGGLIAASLCFLRCVRAGPGPGPMCLRPPGEQGEPGSHLCVVQLAHPTSTSH